MARKPRSQPAAAGSAEPSDGKILLTDEQCLFIVTQYACYARTFEILSRIKEKFGLEITKERLSRYNMAGMLEDPERMKRLGVLKWADHFVSARSQFQASINNIAVADQAYRLRQLDTMYARLSQKGNTAAALKVLEQAAKEIGGIYQASRAPERGAVENRATEERSVAEIKTALKERFDAFLAARANASPVEKAH